MKTFTLPMFAAVALVTLFASVPTASGQNLVRDSNFRSFHDLQPSNAEYRSGQWGTGLYSRFGTWWNSRKADSTAKRIQFTDGNYGLMIKNHSPSANNVFGTTSQRIKINKHAKKYRISMWARAKDLSSDGGVQIIVDRKWTVRPVSMPKGSYDWKHFSVEFDVSKVDTARSGYIDLRIVSQCTGMVQITGLKMEEVL